MRWRATEASDADDDDHCEPPRTPTDDSAAAAASSTTGETTHPISSSSSAPLENEESISLPLNYEQQQEETNQQQRQTHTTIPTSAHEDEDIVRSSQTSSGYSHNGVEGEPPDSACTDDDDDDDDMIQRMNKSQEKNEKNQRRDDYDEDEEDDDDDGADHAEDVPPHVPWQPQSTSSTCEFTHVILDYSEKRESGCKKAEYSAITQDELGNRWRLIIYVNGNGRASNHHLSLFLQVADAEDLPFGWKKAVSYVLTLEHPKGASLNYSKRNPDKTFKLCPKAIDWGWSQFITSDRIQQEGFVKADTLTVRAQVTVKSSSVEIDEEDSELYLKCAVEEGDAASVKLCLQQGASVNCQFKDDLYTPLHTACSSGNNKGSMEVLELLLNEGANGNACNKWKETPLLIAANNGHRAAVQALLKHGADPSLCSEAGWSALTFAAHKGYDDIVELLLKAGAPVNCPVTEDSSMPLHKACAGSKPGHLACVKLLLNAGADVHALNKWRETPLLTAANHGQAGAVQALLAADADPCKCTDTGWSPLSIAAYKGHDEVVRLLLEDGAPTEEEDTTLSALLQAATKGLTETVDLLLRHGADHTVTTKKGDTALSILVEQNLIDAAVDMVTIYNASIPRCSRDRKKVQRARLLINFRMKQLEREGKSSKNDSDSGETDEDDSTTNAAVAQHLESGSASSCSKGKPKKNKKSDNVLAEEIALAAQEALLLELAQEDEKAKKEEAEANSKRAKKRKKKERERQQKIRDEEERRQRQEKEAQERERIRKEKEEKLRQERENKLKEEREREAQKLMEKERKLAAQRKELAEREKPERVAKLEKRETGSVSPSLPRNSEKKGKNIKKPTAITDPTSNRRIVSPKSEIKPSVPLATERRWETASKGLNSGRQNTSTASSSQQKLSRQPVSSSGKTGMNSISSTSSMFQTVDDAGDVLSDSRPNVPKQPDAALPQVINDVNMNIAISQIRSVEHPAVTVRRQEKITELLRSCCQLISDRGIVKRAIYRWILRASHDDSAFLDPLIPSWTDTDKLAVYFQRQFIAETRRRSLLFPGVEALKEAGSSVATLCHHFALQVFEFRRQVEEVIPPDWTDAALGMNILGDTMAANGIIVMSWANGAKVSLPAVMFAALRGRYVGPPSRILTTMFVAKIWYDSLRSIVMDLPMEYRLLPDTLSTLAMEAGVTSELLTDPFSVVNGNTFWGHFENIDTFFGGRKPFPKDLAGTEQLGCRGGSLSVFLPLDATVAAQYVKRMVDVLDAATLLGVPLSFALFIHRECFGDVASDPSGSDLHLFDSRLSQKGTKSYVSLVEILRPGKHSFLAGDSRRVCPETSLFVLLQNDAGKLRFSISKLSAARILSTLCDDMATATAITNIGFANDICSHGTPITPHSQGCYFEVINTFNSDQRRILHSDIGTTGGKPIFTAPFSPLSDGAPKNTRRGRLFDLEDNVDEDQGNEEISEILNWEDLAAGLFQNNVVADIDIEAIGLGISGPHTSRSLNSGNPRPGMFG